MSIVSTMPSSVIGRRISGSFTPARAARTWSTVGEHMAPSVRSGRRRSRRRSAWSRRRPPTAPPGARRPRRKHPVVELLQQRTELGADVVAGGHLAERHPQARHLPGEELHVGVGAGVGQPVALGDDAVAVLLPVLGEQDQRRGVRRLQAEHQGEEDERVDVPRHRRGRRPVPHQPDADEQRHVEQELRGAHEAGELLGEPAEGVVLEAEPGQSRAGLAGDVEARRPLVRSWRARSGAQALARNLPCSEPWGRSRQFSGSRWSSRSSTATAPISRPSSSTTGAATML